MAAYAGLTVSSGETVVVSGGEVVSGAQITYGGLLNIASGAKAVGGTVTGRAEVSGAPVTDIYYLDEHTPVGTATVSGQVVSGTPTIVSGFQGVLGGGYASAVEVGSFGYQVLYSGAQADKTTIGLYGRQMIFSGAVASGAVMESGVAPWNAAWQLVVGEAYDTVVYAYGDHFISSGGVAWRSHVYDLAWQTVDAGGTAREAVIYSGGLQGINAEAAAYDTVVSRGGMQAVYSGAIAERNDVDGVQQVAAGATATVNVIRANGSQSIYGVTLSNTISGGAQFVHSSAGAASGGVAQSNTILSGGSQVLDAGAQATDNTFSAALQHLDGGYALRNTFSGGSQFVNTGSAEINTLTDANQGVVSGAVFSTTILRGNQSVAAGATARETAVESGSQTVAGYASGNRITSGDQWITGSACANTLSAGKQVVNGGYAEDTILNNASQILYGGSAVRTTASGGLVQINTGGSLKDAVIGAGAQLKVYSGAALSGLLVESAGTANLYTSASCAGTITIAAGGSVQMGAIEGTVNFVFDLGGNAATATVFADRYFAGSGYTLRLGDDMAEGSYSLVSNASAFAGSITVKSAEGASLGSLALDGSKKFEGYTCALSLVSEVLTLTVTAPPLQAPTVSADITELTNQSVTVTATFGADSEIKEYSFDKATWQTYTGGVLMDANGTVYFRGKDGEGNLSKTIRYVVSNIDKEAPDAPTAAADITALTNQSVTVTAAFSDDSAVKQFSLDGETWQAYTAPVVLDANGTVSFRGQDAAGNLSQVTSFVVSNIDKVKPEAPTAAADITAATSLSVTVTATFSDDSEVKEYKLGGAAWAAYTAPIVVDANDTVSFRGTDAAGNVSEVTSYVVSNIDKVKPEAPTAAADITAPTSLSVTVTATFSDDSEVREYKLGDAAWEVYTDPVVLDDNGTVSFLGTDAAGNLSDITSFTVSNIDREAPEAPTAVADNTAGTNLPVTVTATFSDDSETKEFSLDGEAWDAYTDPIVMSENGTVYFRAADAAGNVSETTAYTVSNISASGIVPGGTIVSSIGFDETYEQEFSVGLTYAGRYTLSGDFGVLNGSVSIVQGRKSVASGKIKAGVLTFNKGKDVLLDPANEYDLVVKNTDKGKSASAYSLSLNATALFTQGDNSDDWKDLAAAGAAGAVDKTTLGTIGSSSGLLISDGWVGYGDAADYMMFTLTDAASLSLDLSATDAASFTIGTLVSKTKKGVTTYSLKNQKPTKLAAPKNSTSTTATTKELLLTAGTYYLGVQSTNAAKGGNAAYTVSVNTGKTSFFTKGDNSDDDWQALTVEPMNSGETLSGWVGFGDAIDYRALNVNENGGFYRFDLSNVGSDVKVTIYAVQEKRNKQGVLVQSLKQVKSITATAKKPAASTGDLCLAAGTQYFAAVEAPKASKAQNSDYKLAMQEEGVFNRGNETWENATPLSDDPWEGLLTSAAGGDKTDCFDLSGIDGLSLDAGTGKVKVSFFDEHRKAVKANVTYANGQEAQLASVTLAADNTKTDSIAFSAIDDSIRYMKIEAASSKSNTYELSLLA